ncbi:MAG: hypothetical protein QOD42_428 [Sphingomonadales bacterium]|jgi:hypothetical protein|nr:hypothetical protein [Sphingomonadales bacterium]
MNVESNVSRGSLEDQAVEAFAAVAGQPSPIVAQSLGWGANFLRIDESSRELVLDKRAMLLGLLGVGSTPAARKAFSSATTFLDWLQLNGIEAVAQPTEGHALGVASLKYPVVLSASLRGTVLPRAADVAKATYGTPDVSVRHLIVALLESLDGEVAEIFSRPITDAERTNAIHHVVERITENAVSGESTEAWRKIAGLPPLMPGDEDEHAAPQPGPGASAESLRTQADQPAREDQLNRRFFAVALADRLRSTYADQRAAAARMRGARKKQRSWWPAAPLPDDGGSFMAHIHGPWGYGKSSALNFLRAELERERPAEKGDGGANRPWLVVEFNAWKNQRVRPPWWSLITTIYTTALAEPRIEGNGRLRALWWGWRLRADWLPIVLVGLATGLVTFGIVQFLGTGGAAIQVLSGLLALGAAIFAAARIMAFGSRKAAEAYAELKTDPYQPVIRLYDKLIKTIGRPVVIFVDDLDRCESAYVVELIEGIQTLLRTAPVTYVIAADRKWICSAFETKYKDFSIPIGEPARPLGYLFLDKLFQISAALPGLSADIRKGYWSTLLEDGSAKPAGPPLDAEAAAAQVEGKGSIEALNQVIAAAPEEHRSALRAAAAVEITRAKNSAKLEHSLQPFASLLEPNPRAMKRLVNAVGMAQARALLEGRTVSLDTLARWTLIELRWPLLADYLVDNIDAIEIARRNEPGEDAWPGPLEPLAADRHLCAIIRGGDKGGLDTACLTALHG